MGDLRLGSQAIGHCALFAWSDSVCTSSRCALQRSSWQLMTSSRLLPFWDLADTTICETCNATMITANENIVATAALWLDLHRSLVCSFLLPDSPSNVRYSQCAHTIQVAGEPWSHLADVVSRLPALRHWRFPDLKQKRTESTRNLKALLCVWC